MRERIWGIPWHLPTTRNSGSWARRVDECNGSLVHLFLCIILSCITSETRLMIIIMFLLKEKERKKKEKERKPEVVVAILYWEVSYMSVSLGKVKYTIYYPNTTYIFNIPIREYRKNAKKKWRKGLLTTWRKST